MLTSQRWIEQRIASAITVTRGTLAAALTALALHPAAPVAAQSLTSEEYALARSALAAARTGDWVRASGLAAAVSDPAVGRLAFWSAVTRSESAASFEEIVRFLRDNPEWPQQKLLRQRAEEAITDITPAEAVVAWFDAGPPTTGRGHRRYADALRTLGRDNDAVAIARKGWVEKDLPENDETALYVGFWDAFSMEDHARRLDRLLWQGQLSAAQRMIDRVDPDTQAVALARIALRRQQTSPAAAIAGVPEHLRADPGLTYEMARWYRKEGYSTEARQLLAGINVDSRYAGKVWDERERLARESLARGEPREAYAVARPHGLADGSDFVDAEWMTGWIALRFLDDPETALRHFTTLFDNVRYPVSRARGAYWAGRAAFAMDRGRDGKSWYKRAAEQPGVFYGQIAHAELAPNERIILPRDPYPGAEDRARFEGHEAVRAARLLAMLGADDAELRTFFTELVQVRDNPEWRQLIASMAEELGRQDLAVFVSRRALRDGHLLVSSGFPVLALPPTVSDYSQSLEDALVLAVIRQESAFDTGAISSAGARGLMQLMPATARQVASRLKVGYAPNRLTDSPDYNVQLGQAYLASLLNRFGGSYVLALAAYNAGPGRANQWLNENGDPRRDAVEAIDWIEKIPFSETRNYVQRALENVQVYRVVLGGSELVFNLRNDLIR
jgi:soluble lytic murein transglycosylase